MVRVLGPQTRAKIIIDIEGVACASPPRSQTKPITFLKCMAYVSPSQTLAKLIFVLEGVAYASPQKSMQI